MLRQSLANGLDAHVADVGGNREVPRGGRRQVGLDVGSVQPVGRRDERRPRAIG